MTVVHDGVVVADLWGGTDVVLDRPMPADGLMMVASCSKGITATVLAVLVERGEIDPDALVTRYWPEFAAGGKAGTTVGMVAAHLAGLPYPPLGTGLKGLDLHRGPAVLEAFAGANPLWEPGLAMAYHPVSYGTLLDEIVRRATGSSISEHLRVLVAEPLGLDMWIGLPGPARRPRRPRPLGGGEPDGAGRGARGRARLVRGAAPAVPAPRTRRWTPTSPTSPRCASTTGPSGPRSARSPTRARSPGCTPRPCAPRRRAALLGGDARPGHRAADRRGGDPGRERDGGPGHPLRAGLPAGVAEHAGLRSRARTGTPARAVGWGSPTPTTASGSATSAAGCGTSAPGETPAGSG